MDKPSLPITRRAILTAGAAVPALASPSAAGKVPPTMASDRADVRLTVNGGAQKVVADPRVTLIDTVREHLGLTGTKKGCDHGQCGACTVLVDGQATLSCLTLARSVAGPVTTIEGLARGDRLHPMQQAFIDHDAFQCGYCTPGQILSAVALVDGAPNPLTAQQVREEMSGNLCRCAAYPKIVAAVLAGADAMRKTI